MSAMVVGPSRDADDGFRFAVGDVVLVKWEDGKLYYAKLKRIDRRTKKCAIVFDDHSRGEANFGQIHSVTETTTEIVCIVCKGENSEAPNEIVLCDKCAVGYHQLCHHPSIPDTALKEDEPWECTYCLRGQPNPHVSEANPFLERSFKSPPPAKKRRIIPVGASRQSRSQRGSSPRRVLSQGSSPVLCIQRTQPSLVVPGSRVVPQSGSPPGLRNRSDVTPTQPLQECVDGDTVTSHESNENLPESSAMSSPIMTTPSSVITTVVMSSKTAPPKSEPSVPTALDCDVAVSSSQPDAQPGECEVQSPSVSSQRRSEGEAEGGIQVDVSSQPEDSVLSDPVPPDNQSQQTTVAATSATSRPKHRLSGSPVKIRRPGPRGSSTFPKTRTPNRATGKISVFMKGRLQRTGTLRASGSMSQASKGTPIMASRAPPVLPRLKSDDSNNGETTKLDRSGSVLRGSATQQSMTARSPSRVRGGSVSCRAHEFSRGRASSSNVLKPAQPVSSSVTIKGEPPSPTLHEPRIVDAATGGDEQDEVGGEVSGGPEQTSCDEVSELMSISTDSNSIQQEEDVMKEDLPRSQLSAVEGTVKPSASPVKVHVQVGAECSDDPSATRMIVRANSTWRPERPLTLEMLQKMNRENSLSNGSSMKRSQPLPEVPALSKSKSVSDQSSSDVRSQIDKLPTDGSSEPPNDDGVKVKSSTTSSSPKPWDAELRVFASSAGQLDSQAAFEKIRQQVAETKRRREAQEKSSKSNHAKIPRRGSGNRVSPPGTVSRSHVLPTHPLVEEQTNGRSRGSEMLRQQQAARRSLDTRSSPGLPSDPGIIEYSSRELQEKTLQQLFADVNRRMHSGSWMNSVDNRHAESVTAGDSSLEDPQPQILSVCSVNEPLGRVSLEVTSSGTATSTNTSRKFSHLSTASSTYDPKFAQMDETALMNQFDLSFGSFRMPEPRPKANVRAQANPPSSPAPLSHSSAVSAPVLGGMSRTTTQVAPRVQPHTPTAVPSPSLSHHSSHTRTSSSSGSSTPMSRESHGTARHPAQVPHVPHVPLQQQQLQHQSLHQHHSQQSAHHRQLLQQQQQQLQQHHQAQQQQQQHQQHQPHHHQGHQLQAHPTQHHSQHQHHRHHSPYNAAEQFIPTPAVPSAVQPVRAVPSPIATVGPGLQSAGTVKVPSPRLTHSSVPNPYVPSVDTALAMQSSPPGGHVATCTPLTDPTLSGSQGRRSRRNPSTPGAGPHYCKVCGQIAAYLCSGCQRAWYCSPRCQMTDWHTHSKSCEHGK